MGSSRKKGLSYSNGIPPIRDIIFDVLVTC